MSDREKLIEMLCNVIETDGCSGRCDFPPCYLVKACADHLISNGVTVQEWIPVSDPPKTGGSYLVTTEKGAVCTAHFYKNGDVGKWSPGRTIVITHWKPLPYPPKECE